MKLLVAIPAYNCEKQIVRVLTALEKLTLNYVIAICVIENRSTDQTVHSVKNFEWKHPHVNLELWQNAENYGLGGSHKSAILIAQKKNCDYLLVLHGDAQAEPAEYEGLVNIALKDPTLGAVLGSRFMTGSKLSGYSKLRTWGNLGLNRLYSLLTFLKISDLGSGLNLFKIKTLIDVGAVRFNNGFTFNIDLLLALVREAKHFKYVPISWSEEDQVSNARTFRVGWIALKTVFRWRLRSEKRWDMTWDQFAQTRLR